jgi:hypothetical protein
MLLALTDPPEECAAHLAWSAFRRRHQADAKHHHIARRAQTHHPTTDPPVQTLAALPELTDARWVRIAPLVAPATRSTGRPPQDHRTMLAGILWVMRTGSAWRDLPETFGPWATVHSRYQRWLRNGTRQRILEIFLPSDL